ncbi:MAG: TolC family protein [Bacteroidales bacterium]|nr:TolC family protein [Bacteroidales bacterium]
MKRAKLLLLLLAWFSMGVFSQTKNDSVLALSLSEAKIYALANSPVIKNSVLDVESAKKKIWETTAIGLPQVSAKYSYSYIITLPEIYKQFAAMGSGGTGAPTNLDDLRTSSTLDITVSQLLFSGSYLVGLQTSKVYRSLSELSLSKSKQDLAESVTNSYLLVLVSYENQRLVDSVYQNTLKILESMKAMYQQGFVEETDVDQMQITVNNLKNTSDILRQQVGIAERLLKFQLGCSLDQPIRLTDSLTTLATRLADQGILLQNFVIDNQVEYKLLDTQSKLMKLNLRLNQSAFLPEIAAFYQHDKNFNEKSITFTPPDLVGLQVNIPIFSSGMRLARVSQAKISYQKALINQQQAAQSLQIGFEDARAKYLSALNSYSTAYDNFKLAEKVYNRAWTKYREGTISSVELTQVQNQYIQSQTNYFNALLELNSARTRLEKLLVPADLNK